MLSLQDTAFVGVAGAPTCDETTWEQLSYDSYYAIDTNDIISQFVTVDSSIVDSGGVTKVLFRFGTVGASGTLHCCRWDSESAVSSACNFNAAQLLALANHTYWSVGYDALPENSWYGEGVTTESSANVANNVIGFVLTGSGDDEIQAMNLDTGGGTFTHSWIIGNQCASSTPKNGSKQLAFSITTCE